ncbi:MAG: DUF4328 domain-containing protein [Bacteroidia bacterium]
MNNPASVKPARVSAFLAVASIVLMIIGLLATAVLSYLIGKQHFENNDESASELNRLIAVNAQFFFFAFVCTLVFIPIWTYQICRNVRTTFGETPRPLQHLAAWGWFIPIANCFIPFTSLRSCWAILQANFPVIGIQEKKPIPLLLWQIGFCGLVITLPLTMLLLRVIEKQNIFVYNITSLVLLLSFLLGSICTMISILQLYRFEKLAYNQ